MFHQNIPKMVVGFVWLFVVGCAAFQLYYFSVFTVDDAYISFRYAENFARGHGLVFNPGEYVEGYTNFLWVILLGLLKKAGIDVQVSARILGGLSSFITLVMTYLLSLRIAEHAPVSGQRDDFFPMDITPRLFGEHRVCEVHSGVCQPNTPGVFQTTGVASLTPALNTIAILCLATSPAFGIWAVAGLETPLFTYLLVSAVWRHLREETQAQFPFSALLFGLLSLVRPEGIMYFWLTLFSACLDRIQKHRQRVIGLWKNCVVFLLIVGTHFIWRWVYYGSLLPNTYYIKVSGFHLAGIKYVYEFFLAYGGVPLFLVCGLLLLTRRFQEYWLRMSLLLIGTSLLYFIYVGGDWMPEFRFFVPLLPFYFLCLQEGIRELTRLIASKQSQWAIVGAGILTLAIIFNNVFFLYKNPRIDTRFDGHMVIGKLLRAQASPNDVLAAIDIGAMAYFSGLRTIDYFGLTNRHLASLKPQVYTFNPEFWGRHTITLKSDTDYVLAQQPTFIELNTANAPQETEHAIPADPFSDLMFRNPTFRTHYTPFYSTGGTTIFRKKENDRDEH
jgi:arabinofuranosyltransferase